MKHIYPHLKSGDILRESASPGMPSANYAGGDPIYISRPIMPNTNNQATTPQVSALFGIENTRPAPQDIHALNCLVWRWCAKMPPKWGETEATLFENKRRGNLGVVLQYNAAQILLDTRRDIEAASWHPPYFRPIPGGATLRSVIPVPRGN